MRLFRSLDGDNDGGVRIRDLELALERCGLLRDDPRLESLWQRLETELERARGVGLDRAGFGRAVGGHILLLERALQGRLVVPDFQELRGGLDSAFVHCRALRHGEPAGYIPQLALEAAEADRFGIAVCTVDGQRHARGDSRTPFSVQSCHKPVNYALALEEHGVEGVHRHVGREPSGAGFNELALDRNNRPHNPMLNAGAIATASLISAPGAEGADGAAARFEHVINRWRALCGGKRPGFDNAVFLSERATADRNYALAYLMREQGVFPEGTSLEDVLDLYFQSCALELDVERLSVAAATFANGGVCPLTGERVFSARTVQHCLSLMSSCGMYDFSGEFAFTVGVPAKSGVSGAILLVVPGLMGVATWSPRLDTKGNSVRGVELARRLVERFDFHTYGQPSADALRQDPRRSRIARRAEEVNLCVWAASKGDVGALQEALSRGVDVGAADYDLRTPLHLAAAEGQLTVVELFVEQAPNVGLSLSPRDRWGGTPLDDAELHGHRQVAERLRAAGAVTGARRLHAARNDTATTAAAAGSYQTDELIWAAALGDRDHIQRLVARGVSLAAADYDLRTPLHLAAAEGQLAVVRYLLDQGLSASPADRWHATPLDDARRHGHREVEAVLRAAGAEAGRVCARPSARRVY